METLITTLYPLASKIALPMSLAGTTILLFFSLTFFVVKALRIPIEKMRGNSAFKIIMRVVTYGFVLAMIAIVGGLSSFGVGKIYEEYYLKARLIDQGNQAIARQEADTAKAFGKQLVNRWPTDPVGFRIWGTGSFIGGDYSAAAKNFHKVVNLSAARATPCATTSRNMIANLVSALAAASKHTDAFKEMASIEKCSLEKGMRLNYAKLAMVTGEIKKAKELFSHPKLRSKDRPDYRARVYFEVGILALLDAQDDDRNLIAVINFVKADCLDESFGKVMNSLVQNGNLDPTGSIIQDFSFEVDVLKKNFGQDLAKIWSENRNSDKYCKDI